MCKTRSTEIFVMIIDKKCNFDGFAHDSLSGPSVVVDVDPHWYVTVQHYNASSHGVYKNASSINLVKTASLSPFNVKYLAVICAIMPLTTGVATDVPDALPYTLVSKTSKEALALFQNFVTIRSLPGIHTSTHSPKLLDPSLTTFVADES